LVLVAPCIKRLKTKSNVSNVVLDHKSLVNSLNVSLKENLVYDVDYHEYYGCDHHNEEEHMQRSSEFDYDLRHILELNDLFYIPY
jgi:hypothetical protein